MIRSFHSHRATGKQSGPYVKNTSFVSAAFNAGRKTLRLLRMGRKK